MTPQLGEPWYESPGATAMISFHQDPRGENWTRLTYDIRFRRSPYLLSLIHI